MTRERPEKDIALAKAGWELLPIWRQNASDPEIEAAIEWALFVNSHLPQGVAQ